jgi:hypothetical protein
MLNALKICCCPHCAARFALEMDEGRPEPVPVGCPSCERIWEDVILLAPEEREAWDLWRQLAQRVEGLPQELRTPQESGERSPELRPGGQGLQHAICPECGTGAWMPANASRCPVCRASLGLRRTG